MSFFFFFMHLQFRSGKDKNELEVMQRCLCLWCPCCLVKLLHAITTACEYNQGSREKSEE